MKREIKEELNIECDDIYFLTTVQNFFEYESTSYHEILFIYHATINESLDDLTIPFDQKIKYVSLKVSEIPEIKLLPQKAKEIILKRVDIQPLFIDRDLPN
ncbi:NUDIX domain-containing protein [Mammaliicoccus sciuri]|uniref:NUDIX domain-containing protein n=1 Tax=Mammaliicoccus sciuri TaxID=1296 RepID=UPI003CF58ABC